MITDFEFHGNTAKGMGLLVDTFPDIPTPEERYTEYTLPGRDGVLTVKEGTYEDITISVSMIYLENQVDIRERYHETKQWLLDMDLGDTLKFYDGGEWHYLVKRVEIEENSLKATVAGQFTAKFVCDPYQYHDSGVIPMTLPETLYNLYRTSHPVYYISGEGMCTLTVNGNTMTANVSGTLVIDTERLIGYRETDSGTVLANTSLSGYFEDLYLLPGENELSATSGFDVQVVPNWRRL